MKSIRWLLSLVTPGTGLTASVRRYWWFASLCFHLVLKFYYDHMETRLARAYEGVLAMFHNEGRTTTVYNSLQQKTKTKHTKTENNNNTRLR